MSRTIQLSPTVGADCYLRSDNGANTTTNYGTGTQLFAGESQSGAAYLRRAAILVPLVGAAPVPKLATLTQADFGFSKYGTWGTSAATLKAYRIIRAWGETTATWASPWGTAGCGNTSTDRESAELGSLTMPNRTDADGTAYTMAWDLAKVLEWINGGFANNGALLKSSDELNDQVPIASRRYTGNAGWPARLTLAGTVLTPTSLGVSGASGSVTPGWDANPGATFLLEHHHGDSDWQTLYSGTGNSYGPYNETQVTYYRLSASATGFTTSGYATGTLVLGLDPTSVGATPGDRTLRIGWTKGPNATGYKLYRSTDGGTNYSLYETLGDVAYYDDELSDAATYFYKVKGTDGTNDSGYSSAVSGHRNPEVVSVAFYDKTHVDITFERAMGASADTYGNFACDNSINVTGAARQAGNLVVRLEHDAFAADHTFAFAASDSVLDTSGQPVNQSHNSSGLLFDVLPLVRAMQVDDTHTDVEVDHAVDETSAELTWRWTMDGSLSVTAAVLQADGVTLRLTHGAMTLFDPYLVTVDDGMACESKASLIACVVYTDGRATLSAGGLACAVHPGGKAVLVVGGYVYYAIKNAAQHILVQRLTVATGSRSTWFDCGVYADDHRFPSLFHAGGNRVGIMIPGYVGAELSQVRETATAFGLDFGAAVNLPRVAVITPEYRQAYTQVVTTADDTVVVFTETRNNYTGQQGIYYLRKPAATAWASVVLADFKFLAYYQTDGPEPPGSYQRGGYMNRVRIEMVGEVETLILGLYKSQWMEGGAYSGQGYACFAAVKTTNITDATPDWTDVADTALTVPFTMDAAGFWDDPTLAPYTDWVFSYSDVLIRPDGKVYVVVGTQHKDGSYVTDGAGQIVLEWTGAEWAAPVVLDSFESGTSGNIGDLYNSPKTVVGDDGTFWIISNRDGDLSAPHPTNCMTVDYTSDMVDFWTYLFPGAADPGGHYRNNDPHVAVAGSEVYVLWQRYRDDTTDPSTLCLARLEPSPELVTSNVDTLGCDLAWPEAAGATYTVYRSETADIRNHDPGTLASEALATIAEDTTVSYHDESADSATVYHYAVLVDALWSSEQTITTLGSDSASVFGSIDTLGRRLMA